MTVRSVGAGTGIPTVLTLLSALPYPAVAIGNSGLQAMHFAVAGFWAMLPLLDVELRAVLAVVALAILMLPSMAMDGSVNPWIMGVWSWAVVPLGVYLWSRAPSAVVRGFAIAILLHAAVALVQLLAYRDGSFPWAGLYRNPSFAPFDDANQEAYAVWNKRAFGYMPEPSATIAALGAPWLLVLHAALARPAAWLRSSADVALVRAAGAAGVFLFAVGQSGAIPVLAACAAVVGWGALSEASRHPVARLVLVGGTAAVLAIVLVVGSDDLARRLTAERSMEGSWDDRLASIRYTLGRLEDLSVAQWLFGAGPLEVTRAVRARVGSTGVHSVAVAFAVAHGALALIGVGVLVATTARTGATRTARWIRVPATVFLLFSLCVVTGYMQLLSMWLMLGALLVFPAGAPDAVPPAAPAGPAAPAQRVAA